MESSLTVIWYEIHEFKNNNWYYCGRRKTIPEAEALVKTCYLNKHHAEKYRIVKVIETIQTKKYTYEVIE